MGLDLPNRTTGVALLVYCACIEARRRIKAPGRIERALRGRLCSAYGSRRRGGQRQASPLEAEEATSSQAKREGCPWSDHTNASSASDVQGRAGPAHSLTPTTRSGIGLRRMSRRQRKRSGPRRTEPSKRELAWCSSGIPRIVRLPLATERGIAVRRWRAWVSGPDES